MLKSGSVTDIQQLFERLRNEARALVKAVIQLVWYMRGSVSYTELMHMSVSERELVKEFIEEHLETQKKSMHPVY